MSSILSDMGNPILVDECDLIVVSQYMWREHRNRNAHTTYVDAYIPELGRRVFMHRLLMSATRGQRVDHRNGDGMDNRRSENLRFATHQQNMQNARIKANSQTGLKGVMPMPSGRFNARIRDASGKRHYLGTFDTAEAAHSAYTDAARRFHGEFAHVPS